MSHPQQRSTGAPLRLAVVACLILPTGVGSVTPAADLPEPAIPGLRYYDPAEKVVERTVEADVCIYGGCSGGVIAAVQADRMGKRVVLLEFGKHLGGLSSGGLSQTDGGEPSVCGGVAREFYDLIGQKNFRPSQAEAAFEKLLAGTKVEVHKLAHLAAVEKQGTRILSITMEDGLRVRARQFIDATYEGDLLARAGVSWHAGREATSVYGETFNGIRPPGRGGHDWPVPIDPYRRPGDPASGLLPRVTADPGRPGDGDDRIQAFCFRMLLTRKDPLPFPKPTGYDETEYELLARLFESGAEPNIQWRLDTNNHHLFNGAYFIDFVGGNHGWPDGSWLERERIFQAHATYQIGLMWFLANSDRIPEPHRSQIRGWGLPRDEYVATGGWTHQLYIREGRRMVGEYVMTQHNCQGREVPTDPVGLASYNMDSHHCQMTVVDGAVRNEGNVEVGVEPYPIAYRALVPKRAECTNLLVPVAVSSSHIAFGSIRMEPVFMLLGQSAATAAALAIDEGVAVQDVPYDALRRRLLADGQILEYRGPPRLPGGTKAAASPAAGAEPAAVTGPQGGRARPNILLVVADDLGYETLGCYGGKDFATPHLDRLAAGGMRFRRAYTSPVCTPSRMSLVTGTYVTRHGYDFVLPEHRGSREAVDFRDRWTTFPQILRAAGYQTSVTGKWQLGPLEFHPEHCRDAGFDSWCVWQIWHAGGKTERHWNPCLNQDGRIRGDVADRFGPDVLADYVIDRMRAAVAAGRPFCIQHNELLPHTPIVETPSDRRAGQRKSIHRMVAYTDELCGRILAEVERLGILDDTIVIFVGDNGTDTQAPRRTAAGTVAGGKRELNDAGTHVPLLVRWPRCIPAGGVADDLVDMADLFPTICDLAGIELPATLDLDGISFAPRLCEGVPSRREWVTGGIGGEVSLFDGRWRLNLKSRQVIDARDLPVEVVVAEPSLADEPLRRLDQAGRKITSLPRTNRKDR